MPTSFRLAPPHSVAHSVRVMNIRSLLCCFFPIFAPGLKPHSQLPVACCLTAVDFAGDKVKAGGRLDGGKRGAGSVWGEDAALLVSGSAPCWNAARAATAAIGRSETLGPAHTYIKAHERPKEEAEVATGKLWDRAAPFE